MYKKCWLRPGIRRRRDSMARLLNVGRGENYEEEEQNKIINQIHHNSTLQD